MLNKLKLLFAAFQQGKEIANPVAWKEHQVTAAKIATFLSLLLLIAKGFGHDLPVDSETLVGIGAGIYAIGNYVITTITSKKVGLAPEPTVFPTITEPVVTRAEVVINVEPETKQPVQPIVKAPKRAKKDIDRGQFDSTTD